MLALRGVVCSDRWEEAWPPIARTLKQKQSAEPAAAGPVVMVASTPTPVLAYYKKMQRFHRDWGRQQREAEAEKPRKPWKPAPDRPWRRAWRKR